MSISEGICFIETIVTQWHCNWYINQRSGIHKMNIALKEANETGYWLLLLKEGNYLQTEEYYSIQADCNELIKLWVRIVKTTKSNLNKVAN